MAKISNKEVYPEDYNVSIEDYLIGTDSADSKLLRTKTFPIREISKAIQKEIEIEMEVPKKTSDILNDGEDGSSPYATIKQLGGKAYQFSNMSIVPITHALGRYVDVSVMIGTELVIADVVFETDLNTIIVKFSNSQTGVVLIK